MSQKRNKTFTDTLYTSKDLVLKLMWLPFWFVSLCKGSNIIRSSIFKVSLKKPAIQSCFYKSFFSKYLKQNSINDRRVWKLLHCFAIFTIACSGMGEILMYRRNTKFMNFSLLLLLTLTSSFISQLLMQPTKFWS